MQVPKLRQQIAKPEDLLIGCSTPQSDSKGLSRALRSLVKFTGQENPPKSSSKKSRDSELDGGRCLQAVLRKLYSSHSHKSENQRKKKERTWVQIPEGAIISE